MDALRQCGALGWAVPRACGGAGAQIVELSNATFELSRRCASTGMIFAMHQIKVACIARHFGSSPWFGYLQRLARSPRLIASATSEVGVGGDIRRSLAALRPAEDCSSPKLRFQQSATTIFYGAYADDLLTTLRRSP
jgi:acyl-CoA dehydrogenase